MIKEKNKLNKITLSETTLFLINLINEDHLKTEKIGLFRSVNQTISKFFKLAIILKYKVSNYF